MSIAEARDRVLGVRDFVEQIANPEGSAGSRFFHVGNVRGAGAPLLALAAARRLETLVVYVAPDAAGAEAAARDLRYLVDDPNAGYPTAPAAARGVRLFLPSENSPYDNV